MSQDTGKKLILLKEILKSLGSAAIAFSGGVDSTFLLRTAHDVLGHRAVAVTADSGIFPRRESGEAREFCEREGIRQIVLDFDETEVEGFAENPPERCYLCKRALFRKIQAAAEEQRLAWVAEGSNLDDNLDYRPGHRAISELGIRSPLREAGLSKQEIREISRELGLAVWDKPSFACLASRFVYGERITKERLRMVEAAEEFLREQGFCQFRVRIHGTLARIEVLPEELEKLMSKEVRLAVNTRLKEAGFTYVTADLMGYRTGSMNETLEKGQGI